MKLCGGGLALGEVLLLHGTKLAERKSKIHQRSLNLSPLLALVTVLSNTQFTVIKYELAAHHRSLELVCIRIC
jgi:hypothetical protein